jgi:cytochrome P450
LRHIADLPGPRGLPLLGNLLRIRPRRIHLDMERWAQRYGLFFQVRMVRQTILVVADPDTIAALLRDRPDGFSRPAVTRVVSDELGGVPGLFLAEGGDWRRQRRMVMAGFAPHAIKAYFPALLKTALRLQGRWQRAAAAQRPVDLGADLKRYTVDLIAGLAFGTDVNTIEAGDDVIQGHLDTLMAGVARRSIAPFPYWRYVRLAADRRLERSVAALKQAVDGFIVQARQRLRDHPALRERPGNLLEAMLVATDQPDSGLNDDAVAGNVSTMLLAGEDTTANSLCWLIWLLQRHPEAMRRAQREVLAQAPDVAGFSVAGMDGLVYLDACVQESMRLKPVAPYLPLQALADTQVAGIHVPAGCLVWCVMRHHSVADSHFPDAARFDPQRWLHDDAARLSADKRVMLPFGAGARTCPGRYLALLEIKIAMAMLLGSFDVLAVDTDDGREPQEQMGFVMSPGRLTMRLRRRGDGL